MYSHASITARRVPAQFVNEALAYKRLRSQLNNAGLPYELWRSLLYQDPASAATIASRLRELAHQRIVDAFRAQLREGGAGPSEEDLESFARLAWVEFALTNPAGDERAPRRQSVAEEAAGEFADRLS